MPIGVPLILGISQVENARSKFKQKEINCQIAQLYLAHGINPYFGLFIRFVTNASSFGTHKFLSPPYNESENQDQQRDEIQSKIASTRRTDVWHHKPRKYALCLRCNEKPTPDEWPAQ